LQRSEGQSYELKQQLAQMEDQMIRETELLRAEVISSQHDLKQALQVRKSIHLITRPANISLYVIKVSVKYWDVLPARYT
jgi:hypothetical protein